MPADMYPSSPRQPYGNQPKTLVDNVGYYVDITTNITG